MKGTAILHKSNKCYILRGESQNYNNLNQNFIIKLAPRVDHNFDKDREIDAIDKV